MNDITLHNPQQPATHDPNVTLVAAIKPPAMPTYREFEMHFSNAEFNRNQALISREDTVRVIAELEQALFVASYEQAKAMARIIIGRYTKRDMYDPNIWVAEMTRLFAGAPPDLGRETLDEIRVMSFVPNTGDVAKILWPKVKAREQALDIAKSHLKRHDRKHHKDRWDPGPLHGGAFAKDREAKPIGDLVRKVAGEEPVI
ncbi:MAG: hypothetical protein RIB80_04705 [Rhodospirillales bacterium]